MQGTDQRVDWKELSGEWFDEWRSAMNDAMTVWADAVRTMRPARRRDLPRTGRRYDHTTRCGPRPRDCGCECCVVDADAVVEMLAGERRVVAILIENTSPRPVHVTVELSSFSGGEGWASGVVDGPTEFDLEPCQQRDVRVAIEVSAPGEDDGRSKRTLDRCDVSYAELRLLGCAVRSQRIAVAVLPDRCRRIAIDCRCGCC
jgi:hypothetical protein